MNKPERLPHPDFTHWLQASLCEYVDDQKAIPRIAKDAALMHEIEAVLPGDSDDARFVAGRCAGAGFHPGQQRASGARDRGQVLQRHIARGMLQYKA